LNPKFWPVAWHWDGTGWTSIPMPHPRLKRDTEIDGVFAVAPDDIWAAGTAATRYTRSDPRRTLVEHWDGTAWSIVPTPDADPQWNYLNGIGGLVGTDDLWAVGETTSGSLIEHHPA
jgi:hypothetical protein